MFHQAADKRAAIRLYAGPTINWQGREVGRFEPTGFLWKLSMYNGSLEWLPVWSVCQRATGDGGGCGAGRGGGRAVQLRRVCLPWAPISRGAHFDVSVSRVADTRQTRPVQAYPASPAFPVYPQTDKQSICAYVNNLVKCGD